MTYYSYYQSPLGQLLLTVTDQALTGLYFTDQKGRPSIEPEWQEDDSRFTEIGSQLDQYFAGNRESFDLTTDFSGTQFQKSVWSNLLTIPFGKTTSYKAIAEKIGKPKAVRAVGTAIGHNPICIIGPCHRVIASDGTLGGYSGGLPKKEFLLELERHG